MLKKQEGNSLPKYKIFETKEFSKKLGEIFGKQPAKIEKKLKTYVYPQLKEQPYFGNNIKKLRNYTPETWRYRVGDYRFFYEIDEKKGVVSMLTVDHRKDVY